MIPDAGFSICPPQRKCFRNLAGGFQAVKSYGCLGTEARTAVVRYAPAFDVSGGHLRLALRAPDVVVRIVQVLQWHSARFGA
jgi:hypothetical protein